MTDTSGWGTTYARNFYGTKLFYDLGSLDIDCSGGAVSINSSDSPINVGNDAVNQTINVGTAGQRTINIGNSSGTTALNIDAGSGGLSLDASGASNFTTSSGKLTLQGSAGEDIGQSSGTTTLLGDLVVNQETTLTANADLNGALDVAGKVDLAALNVLTTVRGSLNIAQQTTMSGNLQVDAAANVAGLVTLGTSDKNVTIRGNLVVLGELQGVGLGDGTFDSLLVSGNSDLNGTLDVSGQVDLAASGVNTNVRGNLNVTQNTDLDGTLDVAGQVDLGAFGGSADTTIRGDLIVDETLTLTGSGDFNSSLDVSGQVDLAASGVNTGVRGTLSVAENTDLNGDLDVAGQVLLGGSGGSADTTVRGDLFVDGDGTISGDLNVLGNVTSISTTTLTIDDNLVVVNSGPNGSKDGGMLVQRYQTENASGLGDVVSDSPLDNGTAQAVTSTTITFKATSNGSDDYYKDMYILITGATTGANQVRKIQSYVGSTKIATINAWDTVPTGTVTYSLHNKPYVGTLYDESADKWSFVAVLGDPGNTVISVQSYLDIHVGGAQIDNVLDLNGSLDADVSTFVVDSMTNAANAIDLTANGGTSETLRIRSLQGTADNSVDISSTSGGITLTGSKIAVSGDLNVEPATSLLNTASTDHLYFGQKDTEGSWRIGIDSSNLLLIQRHNGTSYQNKAKIG